MDGKWSRFLLLVIFALTFNCFARAQAAVGISDFQCMRGVDTFATGLNDSGQVVGWTGLFEEAQGFIKKKGGPCEPLAAMPGATAIIPLGINDQGHIVGITLPGRTGYGSGFLYEKGQYSFLNYPDASSTDQSQQTCQTFAFSINNRGQIVGLYDRWRMEDGQWVCDGPDHPFIRDVDGTFLTVPTPETWTDSAQANGINPRGMVIGNYLNLSACKTGSCKQEGYVRAADGPIRTFNAAQDAWHTMPTGINPQGNIVGRYFTDTWTAAIGPCQGFFLDSIDAAPIKLTYPGATYTCISAINAPGEVSGSWANTPDGPWRGFVVDLKGLLPTE